MQAFLRWWLIVCLLGGSAIGLQKFGQFEYIYNVDQSSLSFLIFALFIAVTCRIGWFTYQSCKQNHPEEKQVDDLYQYSEFMTQLGLIGTIVGLIITLGPAFSSIDVSDPGTIEEAIKLMTVGMGTALVTTLVGASCSLLSKLQIINFHGKT